LTVMKATNMRTVTMIAIVGLAACGHADPTIFKLERGKVAHVNGCNVLVDYARAEDGIRRATMRYACGAPEAAINNEEWWGTQPQPLMFTVDVGDCMVMDTTYYCLEEIVHAESATFRATYKKPTHPLGNLKRIE